MIDINLTDTWNTCKVALPHLNEGGRGGSIVLTSSCAYDAGTRYTTQQQARQECLRAVLTDAAAATGETRLVLEQDDSLVRWAAQRLIELARAAGCRDRFRYDHLRASAEQLPAVPDAVAWCWTRGGQWRRRVDPVVHEVRDV